KIAVNVGFHDSTGPLAGEPYVVEGLGAQVSGTTDADGKVRLSVPVHVREIRVVFTKRNVAYPVHVGDMDPVDEPSGVRRRLQHLGYYDPTSDAEGADRDERERRAVIAFQKAHGLDPSGVADEATRGELVKQHGS